ncbi:MAG: hypothetical protein NDJ90_12440 [Oligoflexia bacterium]|nr:hypothetical protein [Oligoflexia bacterium]
MRLQLKRLALATLALSFAYQAHADFRDASSLGAPAGIWPEITFVAGADFKEFTRTISQNRDEVRKELLKEFADLVLPMVQAGAEAESAARIVADTILTFDAMHEKHKADASRNLGISLEAIFRAEFDRQFLDLGVSDSYRRVTFLRNTTLLDAVHDSAAAGTELATPIASQLYAQVDFFMYGSYTIQSRGRVTLTLTIEKYLSGESRTFSATGPIDEAIAELARTVFEFFQSNKYPEWINPQPHLQWLAAPRSQRQAVAATARLYCRSQGARLPFLREMILAGAGTGFVPGGIGPFEDGEVYAVSDRQRWNDQYYYFVGKDEMLGGPVRTDAGHGPGMKASYWCVRGTPSDETRFVEALYKTWRGTQDPEIRKGIEYVLIEIGDYGANADYRMAYPDVEAALAELAGRGVVIHVPLGMRLGAEY